MLPAWLDFWTQPSRAAWQRGLKSGMSPLLLPPEGKRAAGGFSSESRLEDSGQVCICIRELQVFVTPGFF